MPFAPLIDEEAVLGGLKDFQRKTVETVFQRLYEDENSNHRFLIADEVGLGKTMVARGFLAKAINHLRENNIKRIDVVYVCSNYEIANQNIRKLAKIYPGTQYARASRLTLLPLETQLEETDLNFISLTPATSLDMSQNRQGNARERALLFHLIQSIWYHFGEAPYKVLQGNMKRENFKYQVNAIDFSKVNDDLKQRFKASLSEDHHQKWLELCNALTGRNLMKNRSKEFNKLRNSFVAELLNILALNCIEMMEPDIIIMDEFQRFRHILSGDGQSELSDTLARQLFNYADRDTQLKTRVLLLSATPYKMFTTQRDQSHDDPDNHYEDFMATFGFLQPAETKQTDLRRHLNGYNMAFQRLVDGDRSAETDILHHKNCAESLLREVMTRTERLSATPDRNGMLKQVDMTTHQLEVSDFTTYVGLQQVAQVTGHPNVMEYWKSGAYLLNFMLDYKFKSQVNDALKSPQQRKALGKIVEQFPNILLNEADVDSYQEVDAGNVVLRHLINTVADWWSLLWMPPSLPYYALEGAFEDKQHITKRLIFSSWKIVPRVVASLVSYEIDRRQAERASSAERGTMIDFKTSVDDQPPENMHGLNLMYPCRYLAGRYDPLRITGRTGQALRDVEARISEALGTDLQWLTTKVSISEDSPFSPDAWYWIAPALFDYLSDEDTDVWFAQRSLDENWRTQDNSGGEGWRVHVEYYRSVVQSVLAQEATMPPMPDELASFLAQLAIGSPGITALRALLRLPESDTTQLIRNHAGSIAWEIRNLFNRNTTLLRALFEKGKSPLRWEQVLQYCVDGNLQAVLDEYLYLLAESLRPSESLIKETVEKLQDVISLGKAGMKVDYFNVTDGELQFSTSKRRANLFALSLTDPIESDTNDNSGMNNFSWASRLRSAFNSPFAPFVLATTSIGQEGLDFHTYSHAIVHWNLPHNPVDLEQREGRVHRYKGHAVRKNLARKYGETALQMEQGTSDHLWDTLFSLGVEHRKETDNDLVPFWIMTPDKNGYHIERYVPLIPFSRDWTKLQNLKQALVFYRMVFGQPRQEDLLHSILNSPEIEDYLNSLSLQIDLSP